MNLPTSLVEELKIWRLAFTASYGRNVSYAQMIRGMLDSLQDTGPAVVEELENIINRHPELKDRLAGYKWEEEKEFNN